MNFKNCPEPKYKLLSIEIPSKGTGEGGDAKMFPVFKLSMVLLYIGQQTTYRIPFMIYTLLIAPATTMYKH